MKKYLTIVFLLLFCLSCKSQITNSIEGRWGFLLEEEECTSSKDYIKCLETYREYVITKDSLFFYVPEIDSLLKGEEIDIKNNRILSKATTKDSIIEVRFSFIDKNRLILSEPIEDENRTFIKIRNDLKQDLSNNLKEQLNTTYYIIADLEADFYTVENIKRFHQTLTGLEIFTWDYLEIITQIVDLPKPTQIIPVKE